MNDVDALDRCAPRAMRIARVKFVALPMDEQHESGASIKCSGNGTKSEPRLFTSLRALLIRVIGRH